MQCTHGNCRDFTLKRRRSRSVGAERLLDAHALRLASSTAGAEAGALFGPCAASELYGDEVKQRFWGGRLHGWSRAKQIKASRCCVENRQGVRCGRVAMQKIAGFSALALVAPEVGETA